MKKSRSSKVGCLEKRQRDLACVREGQRGYFEEKLGEGMVEWVGKRKKLEVMKESKKSKIGWLETWKRKNKNKQEGKK